MKNKLQLKKILFTGVISLLMLTSFGQDSYIKNRWNIKAGYARYNKDFRHEKVGNYRIEVNYGILNNIEIGAYIGYSKFDYYREITTTDSLHKAYMVEDNNTPFYGASFNFHILPFLIKKDDFRFDLYITGKFGGVYFTKPAQYQSVFNFKEGNIYEYGIGGGLSYYLGKHLGVFAEYCYGKYYIGESNKLRYGLAMKF